MVVKVSVIIPVYNPGPYIEPCIRSLLAQSLSRKEFEVIFIDDGSTDDTPARLAELEASSPHLRVITIPNSGWPGKPRNVGTDAAAGEYVMFLDQDDALEPQSLQRMYSLGAVNSSDVVLGKVISDFRGVHHYLYREQRPHCDVFSAQLMNSLTPHKMLRTAFLREQGIRYPEGPRRLEDQLFMTRAYFAARGATIVSDYVCYRYNKRADGRNAGSKRIEPAGYYTNLREVLDVVDAHTTEGVEREGFYRRFLRTEMLGRLSGRGLLKAPPDYLASLLHEVRTLMSERFSVAVDEGLGAALRGHAGLTRSGSIEEIADQAEKIQDIGVAATLTSLIHAGGSATVGVEVRLRHRDHPIFLERGSTGGWLLPASVAGAGLTEEQRTVEPVAEMVGDVVIRHRGRLDEWFLPTPLEARLEVVEDRAEVVWTGTATVDPETAASGSPLRSGLQDFFVRVHAFGITRSKRLGAQRAPGVGVPPLVVDGSQRIHNFYFTATDNLSLNVDAKDKWLRDALAGARFVDGPDGRIMVDLGVSWHQLPEAVTMTLRPADGGSSTVWQLQPLSPGSPLWLGSAPRQRLWLPSGGYQAELGLSVPPGTVMLDSAFEISGQLRRRWLAGASRTAGRRLVRRTHRMLIGKGGRH